MGGKTMHVTLVKVSVKPDRVDDFIEASRQSYLERPAFRTEV